MNLCGSGHPLGIRSNTSSNKEEGLQIMRRGGKPERSRLVEINTTLQRNALNVKSVKERNVCQLRQVVLSLRILQARVHLIQLMFLPCL